MEFTMMEWPCRPCVRHSGGEVGPVMLPVEAVRDTDAVSRIVNNMAFGWCDECDARLDRELAMVGYELAVEGNPLAEMGYGSVELKTLWQIRDNVGGRRRAPLPANLREAIEAPSGPSLVSLFEYGETFGERQF